MSVLLFNLTKASIVGAASRHAVTGDSPSSSAPAPSYDRRASYDSDRRALFPDSCWDREAERRSKIARRLNDELDCA